MPLENLIFQPFEVPCPKCYQRMEASFEELQFNDPITCTKCGNVFSPDKDMEAALRIIKAIEADSRKKSLEAEKKQDKRLFDDRD